MNKGIDSQYFINSGIVIGLILAICGGLAKIFFPFPACP